MPLRWRDTSALLPVAQPKRYPTTLERGLLGARFGRRMWSVNTFQAFAIYTVVLFVIMTPGLLYTRRLSHLAGRPGDMT